MLQVLSRPRSIPTNPSLRLILAKHSHQHPGHRPTKAQSTSPQKSTSMKPASIVYPTLALVGITTAGPVGLAGAAVGCLGICTSALATCHAAGHGLSVFTFGFTSFLAMTSCHQVFLGCQAQCMSSTIVPAIVSPL
ncbi:hypothetical protein B0T16DRAFT_417648 [Cercophora newfieldiana]|uniref:Uncharacterized protein n=1 Tax=Cercophora newfieldiana TaxID=92897 RepID=A0AA40CPD6_9PEZI|nr:hypothetical protein B0T16DRAFT_417648 [Cercophora newfieldiana]